MIKRFFGLFFLLIPSSLIYGQDSVSVLFLGNSYTYVNDLPGVLTSVANSLNKKVYYDQNTPGGYNFSNHASNATTQSKIKLKNWDYVILQAQSQEPSFPDAQVNTETLPYAMELADSVYANNFCSEVMYYMTWGRENGDPQWGPISTFEGMNDRLRSAYLRFADSTDGSVAPVGSAWRYIRDNYPAIQLYSGDGSHPSYEGTYLAACTFYASLFRETPVGASYIGSLSQGTADILQQAAALSVLHSDSLALFNIRSISEHTQAMFEMNQNGSTVDFVNHSTKAQEYYWDFGDGNTSIEENPSHTFSDGIYSVTLTSTSPCDDDVTTMEVTISSAGINENDNIRFQTIENGLYILPQENIQMDVLDELGRQVESVVQGKKIDLRSQSPGVYFIRIKTLNTEKSIKVLLQ